MRVLAALLVTAVGAYAGPSAPERLRVEYMKEPMGVDVKVSSGARVRPRREKAHTRSRPREPFLMPWRVLRAHTQ